MTRIEKWIGQTFWRFALVGLCGLIVDAVILEAGVAIGLMAPVARSVSIVIALQVTYVLHLHFTFRTPELRSMVHRLQFMAVNLIGSAVNYGVFLLILWLQPLGTLLAGSQQLRLLALLGATAVSLFVNYTINRRYIFRKISS
jgi:putative flippase GtrA